MSNENRAGRPATAAPPSGAKVIEEVIAAPGVRTDGGVIGRPAPVVDAGRITEVPEPEKVVAAKKEHTWHRIEIDLSPFTPFISINGQTYHHGHTYTVRDDLVQVLMETMFNTKMHEMVVSGQASPVGRRLQSGGRR